MKVSVCGGIQLEQLMGHFITCTALATVAKYDHWYSFSMDNCKHDAHNCETMLRPFYSQGGRAEFVHQLKLLIGVKDDVVSTEPNKNAEEHMMEGAGAGAGSETKVLRYPDGVHMQDLESALHYTLRMEIPRMISIKGDALQALKDLIRILAQVRFLASFHTY